MNTVHGACGNVECAAVLDNASSAFFVLMHLYGLLTLQRLRTTKVFCSDSKIVTQGPMGSYFVRREELAE